VVARRARARQGIARSTRGGVVRVTGRASDAAQVSGRRTHWQRIKRPASYWPTRYTREVPLWHPWHIGAALVRLRFRYLYWRGY